MRTRTFLVLFGGIAGMSAIFLIAIVWELPLWATAITLLAFAVSMNVIARVYR